MIALSYADVSYAYPHGRAPALQDIALEIEPGDVVLCVGSSGSGKSTLLRAANGLVPHATGGTLTGTVTVHGRSTASHRPRDLADVVGYVHQDPEAAFVVDRVEDDVAFALENLGLGQTAMRRRVEEVLDALGIAHLRDRSPASLSGGEQQRCAIAAALAAGPSSLVLDEPTSQLDPQGAEDVLAALARLNDDLGTTILLAEHRLLRAGPMAHRVLHVADGRLVGDGTPREVLTTFAGAAPVTHLGHLLHWDPVPLTVREARRAARGTLLPAPALRPAPAPGELLLRAAAVDVTRAGHRVLGAVDLDVHAGEVVALMGRNGSGKTSLLRALAGLDDVGAGAVSRHGAAATGGVGHVPQDPNTLLSRDTVRAEVAHTLRLLRQDDGGRVDAALADHALLALADRHPRELSGGQRQRVAIAAVAVGGATVLLLDEPTRGMDAEAMAELETVVARHAAAGGAVVLATHDVELAARLAQRVVLVGDGEVIADGPARDVLAGSLFAPQVLRVLPPFLTVADVAAARRAVLRREPARAVEPHPHRGVERGQP